MLDVIKKDKARFDAQQGADPQGRCVGGSAGLSPLVLRCSLEQPCPTVPYFTSSALLLGGRSAHLGRIYCSHLRFDIKGNSLKVHQLHITWLSNDKISCCQDN